ncbi:MAG TPA: hypothetical protein VHP34_11600 [Alphaproteobacteria bacterium]|nr:hypothetical protein [Alphaproteobacteria bacterium]
MDIDVLEKRVILLSALLPHVDALVALVAPASDEIVADPAPVVEPVMAEPVVNTIIADGPKTEEPASTE